MCSILNRNRRENQRYVHFRGADTVDTGKPFIILENRTEIMFEENRKTRRLLDVALVHFQAVSVTSAEL